MQEIDTRPSSENMTEKVPFFQDPKKRSIVFQFCTLAVVAMLGYYLFSNTVANLERQAIATGFGFHHLRSANPSFPIQRQTLTPAL